MKHYPIPVVVVSSLAAKGSQIALEAIASGAVDVMCKPGVAYSIGDLSLELCEKIKGAAQVDMERILHVAKQSLATTNRTLALTKTTNKIIVIGSSTGGVQAIEAVIRRFPPNAPGTVICQHMPAGFTKAFADRLNTFCEVEVREAKDGDSVTPGVVLIAPGAHHMMVKRSGANYHVEVKDGPLVNKHKPSVEVLFNSAATYVGANAIGVMLTGMGADGAKAMLKMREAGALTIAQDEKTSVVYGMPRAAVEAGAVEHILPIDEIAPFLIKSVS